MIRKILILCFIVSMNQVYAFDVLETTVRVGAAAMSGGTSELLLYTQRKEAEKQAKRAREEAERNLRIEQVRNSISILETQKKGKVDLLTFWANSVESTQKDLDQIEQRLVVGQQFQNSLSKLLKENAFNEQIRYEVLSNLGSEGDKEIENIASNLNGFVSDNEEVSSVMQNLVDLMLLNKEQSNELLDVFRDSLVSNTDSVIEYISIMAAADEKTYNIKNRLRINGEDKISILKDEILALEKQINEKKKQL